MGGCSEIAVHSVPATLRVILPSIPRFLFEDRGDYEDCYYQDTHQWISREYADRVMQSRDLDLITDWYSVSKRTVAKLNYWTRDTEYFNPDKWHPNLAAHERIAELLDRELVIYRDSSQCPDSRGMS